MDDRAAHAEAANHAVDRLLHADVVQEPFPHYCLDRVFPDPYYEALLRNLPDGDAFERLYDVTDLKLDHFRHRDQCQLDDELLSTLAGEQRDFMTGFASWFLGPQFCGAVMASFRQQLEERLGAESGWPRVSVESEFIRHRAGYFLGPHSDLGSKLVVLLLYLPSDSRAERLGTTIFRPKKPGFCCPDSTHYAFEDFVPVKTAPYRPNSLLAFLRSDVSFHGVAPISDREADRTRRDLIQYVVYDERARRAQLAG